VSRPTKYDKAIQKTAEAYVNNFRSMYGHQVPSLVGLARVLKVSKRVIYNWRDEHEEFMHTLEDINDQQHLELINNGLDSTFNTPITKLMMANHGYSDKIEQDLTSSDGTMKPVMIELVSKSPEE
jgi:hypothetical protein